MILPDVNTGEHGEQIAEKWRQMQKLTLPHDGQKGWNMFKV
jgi:hypothetical protein